ncbi:MAG: hypothetical protein AB7W37_17755 [Syntrophobacteraceae bacterium]
MKNRSSLLIITSLMVGFSLMLSGCGPSRQEVRVTPQAGFIPQGKVRVVDVSNATGELYDVDCIGMLWTALEDSLNQSGLLWTGGGESAPIEIKARIVKYDEGNLATRYLSPIGGDTELVVEYSIMKSGKELYVIDSKHSYSFSGGMTFGGWRKVFTVAAEDVVREIRAKMNLGASEQ